MPTGRILRPGYDAAYSIRLVNLSALQHESACRLVTYTFSRQERILNVQQGTIPLKWSNFMFDLVKEYDKRQNANFSSS